MECLCVRMSILNLLLPASLSPTRIPVASLPLLDQQMCLSSPLNCCLFPGTQSMWDFMCDFFKGWLSVSYSPLDFHMQATGLQAQTFLGFVFLAAGPLVWRADIRLLSLTPWDNLCNYDYLLVCGSATWEGLRYIFSLPLLPALFWVLLLI